MNVIVEYLPDKDPKKTEKMIDDLRVLGLNDLMIETLATKDNKDKKGAKGGR
jgi:hypothetical protein